MQKVFLKKDGKLNNRNYYKLTIIGHDVLDVLDNSSRNLKYFALNIAYAKKHGFEIIIQKNDNDMDDYSKKAVEIFFKSKQGQ